MFGSEWTSIRSELGPEGEIEQKVGTEPGSLAERWALWNLNRTRRTWTPWWLLPAVLLATVAVQVAFFSVMSSGSLFPSDHQHFLFRGQGKYYAGALILNLCVIALTAMMLLERRGYAELLHRYAIELRRLQGQKSAGS